MKKLIIFLLVLNSFVFNSYSQTTYQTIHFQYNWDYFSTYLDESSTNIATFINPIISYFQGDNNSSSRVVDEAGNVYYPYYGLNMIGNMTNGKAYHIHFATSIPDSLVCSGTALVPENTAIHCISGWGYIGYTRSSIDTDDSLSYQIQTYNSSVAQYVVMIKDHLGNSYWPTYDLDNIKIFKAGQGYQIFVSQTINIYFSHN